MNLASHVLERLLKLPPPITRNLVIQRDLPVPVGDGVELLTDRWAPAVGGDGLPLAVVRTPYGRRQMGLGLARPLAERGYQVLMQSVRGTFGSGGEFVPFRYERDDGLATLEWAAKQPWFGGSVVLIGASYLGYTQWAVADAVPTTVKAMIPVVTESALALDFLRPEAFALETPFGWGVMVAGQERPRAALRTAGMLLFGDRKTQRALRTLPLNEADVVAVGERVEYVQAILAHDADDPHWVETNHRARVADVTIPVSSVAGWYDIFLPSQLRDYQALRAAGRDTARLTVGPWTHASGGGSRVAMREVLVFGLKYARGEQPPERAPVRLYVMGAEQWRDVDTWPPAGYQARRYHLQPDGGLAVEPAAESAPDRYRYDPADPTPAVGGVRMIAKGGRVDNRRLEARADVLTYTTAPLDAAVEVIGEVSAEVWVRSSLPHADVFVRLCDVDERGRSYNVCDGLVSVTGADELRKAIVELWPTAYRFLPGHRIRVQVSSGAFPRYDRNSGTGAPRGTATELRAADQEVHHDTEHPSAVILPVRVVL